MKKASYYPVRGWSFAGRMALFPFKKVFKFVALLTRKWWKNPIDGFEENPAYFTWKDAIYLGTKYYGHPYESGKVVVKERRLSEISPPAQKLSLHAGGDLMPYKVMLGGKSDQLWSLCGDHFFGADLTIANLETPMDFSQAPSYVPELMLNDMMFNGSHELWDVFTAKGKYHYDYLSFANNHMLDAGTRGLKATLNWLQHKGVSYSGAKTEIQGPDYALISKNDITTAIVNYTYSLNRVAPDEEAEGLIHHLRLNHREANLSLLFQSLKKAKNAGADLIIASLHMGNAYQCYPTSFIRERILEIFENGSPDIIFIHHPHNLQPAEVVRYIRKSDGKLCRGIVYYSLGDFVAYDIFSWSHLTGYARIEVTKNVSGELAINSGFEFLYLYRDKKGNFVFVPWQIAMSDVKFQDSHYSYLKDWYDRHASGFFS